MPDKTEVKPPSEQVDRGGDHTVIINPTKQPTGKKLTFVQWVAKEENISVKRSRANIRTHADAMVWFGIHTEEEVLCTLCKLEQWLTEYKKYFKQK